MTMIIKDRKSIESPESIANIMSKEFVSKIEDIRNNIVSKEYEAINTYKKLVPRVEKKLCLQRKTVADFYETLMKQKTSNARGNDEITSRTLKQMPHYISLAICHLYNAMLNFGKFLESLKVAREP